MYTAFYRFSKPILAVGVFVVFVLGAAVCPAQEPALPEGMETGQEQTSGAGPALPSGLGDKTEKPESDAPGLPSGLGGRSEDTEQTPSDKTPKWQMPEEINGFVEARGGLRIHDDPVHDDVSLAETRLQLSYDKSVSAYIPRGRFRTTADLLFDATVSDHDNADLEEGTGFLDLREFWLSFTPVDFIDIRAGRQILTWGTGNLVFLNDLFPKDYQSFFLGRDLEYLKAPADAVKASIYGNIANVDIVYSPRFDSDRFPDGSRLSFYDPSLEGCSWRGEDNPMDTRRPDDWFADEEVAVRVYRNIGAYELAAYGYHGFWKGPSGTDSATDERIFPERNVLGASLRGTLGPGIANTEFSWYHSEDDEDGSDPFVENSQMRYLVGYEQEVATDLTLGVQYYVEYMLDYDAYEDSLLPGFPKRDQARQWLTLDLTQELMAQNQLRLSLFTFYSLSANEFYFRPKATYDYTDNWKLQAGANIFMGERTDFFGRFEESSNVYAAVRYGF
ncbi:MAG: hypothetical protein K9K81_12885 [Desulfobacteraceae bacterium]|nr:hypothetical protein [Desulfobacteraceae bacterium]